MQTISRRELVLEPLTAAHADVMFEVLSDPEIYRYLDDNGPPSAAHLRGLYTRWEARQSADGSEIWLNWMVRLTDQQPIGYVQATVVASRTAWIAYVLSSKYWGHGYALLATGAMLDHLTAAYGVERMLASVEAANQRSIRLLERLSFRPATPREASSHDLSTTERLFVR